MQNALWPWRTFTETDRLAVSIVARQLDQDVFVPWIAAREAEEEYRRSLQEAVDELERAHSNGAAFRFVVRPGADSGLAGAATQLRYSTVVSKATPIELIEQRRYEQAKDAVIVVNARWALTVGCRFQERDTDTPELWSAIQDVKVEGSVQLFLEERGNELQPAEFIGAQLTSDTHFFFTSDGTLMSVESIAG
jgi:hypothetical protein